MVRGTEVFLRRSFLQRMKRGQCRCWGDACRWLDVYFQAGSRTLLETPSYRLRFPTGGVGTAAAVPLRTDPTYGALAKQLAEINGGKRVSAQAVGGAVGHNPVSIIVPCHRVVGSDGSLTGYAGGIEKEDTLADAGKRRGGKSLPITKSRPSRRDDLLLLYVSFTCSGCTRRWPWRRPCLHPWP